MSFVGVLQPLQHHRERRHYLHGQHALGLSKASNLNQAGTLDSIGAFSTVDTALQVNTFPPGTTLSFGQNSASANLNLPAGSTVLYAELTWGGGYSFGGQDVSLSRNNAITFITPAGTSSVIPDPTFQRNLGTPSGTGTCTSGGNCFYVRTANVTDMVKAAGAGTYTVGGVAASVGASENSANCAGWTLAVVYQSFSLPVRNLALFAGSELLEPMELTIEAGNQCVSGQLSLQPKGTRGAGFP